jgi:hypothetical protein
MPDQTDIATDAARVLLLHASFKASPEIQLPDAPWSWECDGCGTEISLGGTGRNTVFAGLAKHQAAMLAEAGLLRDTATIDALNERCRILVDQTERDRADLDAAARMREVSASDLGTKIKLTQEQARTIERVRGLSDEWAHRHGMGNRSPGYGSFAAALREALQDAQNSPQGSAGGIPEGDGGPGGVSGAPEGAYAERDREVGA